MHRGLIGLLILVGYIAVRRHPKFPPVLPAGLDDTVGAAALLSGTAGLASHRPTKPSTTEPAASASAQRRAGRLRSARVSEPAASLYPQPCTSASALPSRQTVIGISCS
jgi:hypothetical protein